MNTDGIVSTKEVYRYRGPANGHYGPCLCCGFAGGTLGYESVSGRKSAVHTGCAHLPDGWTGKADAHGPGDIERVPLRWDGRR